MLKLEQIRMPGTHWYYPGSRWWKFDFHTPMPISVHVVDCGRGQCMLKQPESLQAEVREEICRVMEGGRVLTPLETSRKEGTKCLKTAEHCSKKSGWAKTASSN